MLKDFHFYAIFGLCRLAGMKREQCKKVAYASQHTDDAKYGHVLYFASGGRYQQTLSAHSCFDLKFFTKDAGYDVFMPFHFLPGGQGNDFDQKLICRKDSITCREMLKDTLLTLDKPYGAHRLGVALHVYADSWSHQNFIGLKKEQNEVKSYTYINSKNNIIEQGFASMVPAIGHAQTLLSPDESYLIWKYKKAGSNSFTLVNNTERFMEAAKMIYDFLTTLVYQKAPSWFEVPPRAWATIEQILLEHFQINDSLTNRIKIWEASFKKGRFGFTEDVSYDDREWFKKAVDVSTIAGEVVYDKKPGFEYSDWKLFHDALTLHSFYIKHELLPRYGVIT